MFFFPFLYPATHLNLMQLDISGTYSELVIVQRRGWRGRGKQEKGRKIEFLQSVTEGPVAPYSLSRGKALHDKSEKCPSRDTVTGPTSRSPEVSHEWKRTVRGHLCCVCASLCV